MKFYILFSLFLRVLSKGILSDEDLSEQIFSTAFENVTRHLFQLETRMFINNFGIDSDTITSMILKNLNENAMPFQLKNLQLDTKKILLDSSTLLTFNKFAFVREFNQKLSLTNEYFKPLQLFVYCQNITIRDIESLVLDVTERAKKNKIIEKVENWNKTSGRVVHTEERFKSSLLDIIQYEYFLVEETNDIKLLTFVWFSPGKCSELSLIELNKFNKFTRKWEDDKFSMMKATNLHGCLLRVALAPVIMNFATFSNSLLSFSNFDRLLNCNFTDENFDFGETGFELLISKGC